MSTSTESIRKLLEEVPSLKAFAEVMMRSIGGSACLVFNIFKSVMTGSGCSIFKSIDWKACSKDPKLKEFGKKVLKMNEMIRDANSELLVELKDLFSSYLTQKTYFDQEDAQNYVKDLENQYNNVGNICDTLLEMTNVLDLVSGKNNAKFKKQITNLQSRIEELESKPVSLEQNQILLDKVSNNDDSVDEGVTKICEVGALPSGSSLNLNISRNQTSLPCIVKLARPSKKGKFVFLTGENYNLVKVDHSEDREVLQSSIPLNALGTRR